MNPTVYTFNNIDKKNIYKPKLQLILCVKKNNEFDLQSVILHQITVMQNT